MAAERALGARPFFPLSTLSRGGRAGGQGQPFPNSQ